MVFIEEKIKNKNHSVNLLNREILNVSEVVNIEYFTPEAVAAKTICGRMIIKGKNLVVDTMESKTGNLLIKGTVNEIIYENNAENKSLIKKLFK